MISFSSRIDAIVASAKMSSNHLQSPNSCGTSSSRLGEIAHLEQFSNNFASLFLNEEYSDVALIVEGQRLHAHKVILAARSEYFRALLYGGMKESNQSEIEMPDAALSAFKALLKYIYSGHMFLISMKEEVILETLGLAHQYGFQELETAISDILRQLLALKNVCAIIDTARLYGMDKLVEVCHLFFDQHASEILDHESFISLSQASLVELLKRDSFFAPEVEIFKGVCKWCRHNEVSSDEVIDCVRLSLMTITDLLSVVRPADLVKPDTLLDAIAERTSAKVSNLPHRGQLILNENVATQGHGSKVIAGELLDACIDGDIYNYDLERGYTRHTIGLPDQCIIVKLGKPSIINHLKLLLWDRDNRSYSYYIEVSLELKDWIRVIDYNQYACRSWQSLFFDTRVVQYIKIVGTNNTSNKVFHLVSLNAMYKETLPTVINGVICPTSNVATLEKSACVIEGVCRSRNALLNGDTKHYNLDSGYTCHQVGSGSILIQLGQPYMLSSLRLLLWDCDDRSYSYYIESSVNIRDWEVLVDRTRERCKSWQVVRFPARPVVFIRIVGTYNTANEVFHCVHFECPSSTDQEELWKTESKSTQSGSTQTSVRDVENNNNGVARALTPNVDAAQSTETATEAEELHYAWDDAVD